MPRRYPERRPGSRRGRAGPRIASGRAGRTRRRAPRTPPRSRRRASKATSWTVVDAVRNGMPSFGPKQRSDRRRQGTRSRRRPRRRAAPDCVLTRRWFGVSTPRSAIAIRRTSGVRTSAMPRGREQRHRWCTATGSRFHRRAGVGLAPRVQARHRESAGDLGDPPARRARAAASSRCSMASAISRAIARISSGPMPRDVTAGVPTRIPDEVFGRLPVERDLVLVDGDPDLVEEVLGVLAGDARATSRRRASGGCRCRRTRPAGRARRGPPRSSPRSRRSVAGRARNSRRGPAGGRPPCRRSRASAGRPGPRGTPSGRSCGQRPVATARP